MPFLPPNQQRQSTEGNSTAIKIMLSCLQLDMHFGIWEKLMSLETLQKLVNNE